MGALQDALAAIDHGKRLIAGRAKDMVSDPSGYARDVAETLNNGTNCKKVVFGNGFAGPLNLSRQECEASRLDQALGSIGGGLGVVRSSVAGRGPLTLVDKYKSSELPALKKELADLLSPATSLGKDQLDVLKHGLGSLENSVSAEGLLYRNANGEPSAYATVTPSGELGSWLSALVSMVPRSGAGTQAIKDIRRGSAPVTGYYTDTSKDFYRKLGARLDEDSEQFEFKDGGQVRGYVEKPITIGIRGRSDIPIENNGLSIQDLQGIIAELKS